MNITSDHKITLNYTCCYLCGIPFGMPDDKLQQLKDHGGQFFCPNGHGQVFSKSRVKVLEEQLNEKQRELTAAKCETMAERHKREEVEKQHARLVEKGLCPCCRRNFSNVRRHIKHKHPEYLEKSGGRK